MTTPLDRAPSGGGQGVSCSRRVASPRLAATVRDLLWRKTAGRSTRCRTRCLTDPARPGNSHVTGLVKGASPRHTLPRETPLRRACPTTCPVTGPTNCSTTCLWACPTTCLSRPGPAGETADQGMWSRGAGRADYFSTEGSGEVQTRTEGPKNRCVCCGSLSSSFSSSLRSAVSSSVPSPVSGSPAPARDEGEDAAQRPGQGGRRRADYFPGRPLGKYRPGSAGSLRRAVWPCKCCATGPPSSTARSTRCCPARPGEVHRLARARHARALGPAGASGRGGEEELPRRLDEAVLLVVLPGPCTGRESGR